MEKNENGYPVAPRMAEQNRSTLDMREQNRSTTENNTQRAQPQRDMTEVPRAGHCGEAANELDSMTLAYVYAPKQRFCMLYSSSDALNHGTLFEQLYKPMEVYGRE